MTYSFFLIPFIAAFIGWLTNKIVLRVALHRFAPKELINGMMANINIDDFFSIDEIAGKITSDENLQKIMPAIDEHIDHFLKVKLKQSMPVVGMFIGEKTTAQLKSVFLDELQILFPQIMNNYVSQIKSDFDIKKILLEKVESIPSGKMKTAITEALSPKFKYLEIAGAIMGFVIGIMTVLITFIAITMK